MENSLVNSPRPEASVPTVMLLREPEPVDDGINLADVVRFLYAQRYLLVGWTLAAGIFGGGLAFVLIAKSYVASATLAITPPKIESGMALATMTVQAYQRILESDAIKAEVRRGLVTQGLLKPSEQLDLSTNIFVSKRADDVSLAPLIQLNAKDTDPERAAVIVNQWTSIFLDRVKVLNSGATGSAINFVDAQYATSKEALSLAEKSRNATAEEEGSRHAELTTVWEQRISELTVANLRARATYDDETKRQIESFQAQNQIETQKILVETTRRALETMRGEFEGLNTRITQVDDELKSCRLVAETIPPLLLTRKAISDDAAWQAAGANQKALLNQGMVNEQVNPVYADLQKRIANLQVEQAAVASRTLSLTTDMEAKRATVLSLETAYRKAVSSLDELTRSRSVGSQVLADTQALAVAKRQRERDTAMLISKNTTESRLATLDRNLTQALGLYEQFAKYQVQAQMAKAQEDRQDVRLVAAAVPPDRPDPSRRLLFALVAALAGGCLGLLHAVIRQALAQVSVRS